MQILCKWSYEILVVTSGRMFSANKQLFVTNTIQQI